MCDPTIDGTGRMDLFAFLRGRVDVSSSSRIPNEHQTETTFSDAVHDNTQSTNMVLALPPLSPPHVTPPPYPRLRSHYEIMNKPITNENSKTVIDNLPADEYLEEFQEKIIAGSLKEEDINFQSINMNDQYELDNQM